MQNKAVIVGALGVIGRYIVEKLIEEPDWTVVGLSRRASPNPSRARGGRLGANGFFVSSH
jgi:nucleoside-diphosphate-sugar epimerase